METNQKTQEQVKFLYNASAKILYNLALYTLGNHKAAEQITIDAFSEAFYNMSDKMDAGIFKEQSIKILYKYGRKIRKKTEFSGYTMFVRTVEDMMNVKKKELTEMLCSLCFDERYILLLFCWNRFSIQQIAKVIHSPVFLVKKRLHRAVNKAIDYMVK